MCVALMTAIYCIKIYLKPSVLHDGDVPAQPMQHMTQRLESASDSL